MAAVKALEQGPEWFSRLNDGYRVRREAAGRIFDLIGARYDHASAGLFLWGKVDGDNVLLKGRTCRDEDASLGERVSDVILHEAGVFITPGFIFGKNGRDYVRISLCATPEVLADAEAKIREIL